MGVLEDELKKIDEEIRALEKDLSATIADAEKDGEVTLEEKKLIEKARGHVEDAKALREEIAGDADTPKETPTGLSKDEEEELFWKHNGENYKKVKDLHRDLEFSKNEHAAELGKILTRVDQNLKDKFFFAAIMGIDQATELADDEKLWDAQPPLPKSEEEELFWEHNGDNYRKLKDLLRDIEFKKNEHTEELAKILERVDKNIKDQTYFAAIMGIDQAMELADDENLWDERPPLPKSEEEDLFWKHHGAKHKKITGLLADLKSIGHEGADELGDILERVEKNIKDQAYFAAIMGIDQAFELASDEKLWDAAKDVGGEDLMPSAHRIKLAKIKDLRRDLDFKEHDKAVEFGNLVDSIPEKVTKPLDVIPADRALQKAYEFADKHKLWDARPPLPKSEEEKLFWQHHGKNYQKAKDLLSRLEVLGHELEKDFRKIIDSIDKNIDDQTYFAAIMGIDQALEFADDEKLWEETPKEVWDGLQKDVERIRKLFGALYDMGHESAKELGDLIDAMDDARRGEDWEDAERQLTAALALADGLKLWDVVKTDDDEDEEDDQEDVDPQKAAWEARRAEYDQIVALHDRLISETSPDAPEFGKMLTAITDAVNDEYWQDAEKFLDIAIKIAKDKKLWDGGGDKPEDTETIDPASASISASVGQSGKNRPADVKTVQLLLNQKGATPPLVPDSDCGKLTIGAIKKFQQAEFGWKDGRVDPGGKTWAALTGQGMIGKMADAVEDVVDKVADTAGKAVDKAKDIAEDIVDDIEDLLGGLFDDDKKSS